MVYFLIVAALEMIADTSDRRQLGTVIWAYTGSLTEIKKASAPQFSTFHNQLLQINRSFSSQIARYLIMDHSQMGSGSNDTQSPTDSFKKFDEHDFSRDEEFQACSPTESIDLFKLAYNCRQVWPPSSPAILGRHQTRSLWPSCSTTQSI